MDNREGVDRYVGEYLRGRFNGHGVKYDFRDRVLGEGTWEDGELELGIEYDWLFKVDQGALVYSEEEGDYDAEGDFSYSLCEQYGYSISPFHLCEDMIAHEGLEAFFVADRELLEGNMEQLTNIRKLDDYLREVNPELLKRIMSDVELYREDQQC